MTDQMVNNRFTVCVRKRPLNDSERSRKEAEVISVPSHDTLIVEQSRIKLNLTKHVEKHKFEFDEVFDETASNEMVYKSTVQPLVKTIFEQGFATCFAYGQRGSGKTYTMSGDLTNGNQNYANGMYAMAANEVLELQCSEKYKNLGLTVSCSFYEIYGEKVFDLLNKRATVRIIEDNRNKVQIVGLEEISIYCKDDILRLIQQGTEMRSAGSNSADQSRNSHAVFQIVLRRNHKLLGKFTLIDLASDSRDQDATVFDRQTRIKQAEIYESLFALKECLRAMAINSQYIPFRASKLTLLLRDSLLKPNSRICMLAHYARQQTTPAPQMTFVSVANCRKANCSLIYVQPNQNRQEDKEKSGKMSRVREYAKEGGHSGLTNELLASVLSAARNDALFNCYLFNKSMTYWMEENRSISSKSLGDDEIARVIKLINSMSSELSRYLDKLKKWQDLKAAAETSRKGCIP